MLRRGDQSPASLHDGISLRDTPTRRPGTTAPALASARIREKRRTENFPVASRLLPPAHRRHLLALYGFARTVDDVGDELGGDERVGDERGGNRLRALEKVSGQLDRLFAGTPPADPVFRELALTVRECGLPREPFDRLVEANRHDQLVRRYPTFDDLLAYCELSANPVGRLVLGVFGVSGDGLGTLSDRICTALQILEHCQDVGEDARAGRIYLPGEDLAAFGVREHDLLGGRATRALRALIGYQVQRAVRLLDEGRPLVARLPGTARVAVAGFLAGGRATAVALAGAGFGVLPCGPRPGKVRMAAEWTALLAAAGAR